MEILWLLIPILGFGGFFAWYFLIHKPNKQKKFERKILENTGIPTLPKDWANSEATPRGMRVMWNGNPFNSDAEKQLAFKCFDIGFENAFNAMRGKFPTWDFNPGFVNIGIVEGNDKTEAGAEAIRMFNGLKIAGAVVGTGEGYPLLAIIIPSQKPNGWRFTDFVMRTVWNECEHFYEFRSDTHEFLYWGHVVPDAHPHHPLPPDVAEIPAPEPISAVRALASIFVPFKCGTVTAKR